MISQSISRLFGVLSVGQRFKSHKDRVLLGGAVCVHVSRLVARGLASPLEGIQKRFEYYGFGVSSIKIGEQNFVGD